MAKLVFTKGVKVGQEFVLLKPEILIGRHERCDLIVIDGMVSGHHARMRIENGRWVLVDLDSSNGTVVNGHPIRFVELSDGDRILLGDEELTFWGDGAPAAPAAAAPGSAEPAPAALRVVGASADELELVQQMKRRTDAIRTEVAKIIVGQQDALDQILMVLIAGGHGLLVGLPGMAKTLMVRTIARVLDLEFKRIQFTPDLMPADITGTEILETNRDTMEKEFRFIKGPIFTNLLLADEINRTPPKTQAALLEAMQEKRVTAGNRTYTLDEPFFVLATQNPIEQEGTYPLPEAQMDRFMFNIWIDYPHEAEEETIISTTTVTQSVEPGRVLNKQEVLQLQDVVRKIPVSEHVIKYTTRLVRSTRPADARAPDIITQYASIGAGPRAGQYLILAAKARAVLEGRIHVSCQDVRRAALPVLRHRIYTNFTADSEGVTPMALIDRLLRAVEEPSDKDYQPAA